jgi:hypothetical protein
LLQAVIDSAKPIPNQVAPTAHRLQLRSSLIVVSSADDTKVINKEAGSAPERNRLLYARHLLLAARNVRLAASRIIFAALGSLSYGAKRQHAEQSQHLDVFTHHCHLL